MNDFTSIHTILGNDWWCDEELKFFIEEYAYTVNEVDLCGRTPLHRMLHNLTYSNDIIKHLIDNGADVNHVSRSVGSPLFVSLRRNRDAEVVRALIEKGANVSEIRRGKPLLCTALRRSSVEVISVLLKAGCSPTFRNDYGSLLHYAIADFPISNSRAEVCKLLLDAGANAVMNELDRNGQSLFCFALRRDIMPIVKLLLAEGCSINACTKHVAPWQCATVSSSNLSLELVKLLFDACGYTNCANLINESPLHCALAYCTYEESAIRFLLDLQVGDFANARSSGGETLLHAAASNPICTPSIIKLLLDRGVQADSADGFGNTPLHLLLKNEDCKPDNVRVLLGKGARVENVNGSGETPLSIAVQKRQGPGVLELLLGAGARIHSMKISGMATLELFLREYDCSKLRELYNFSAPRKAGDIVKTILKFSLLEGMDSIIRNAIEGRRKDYGEFIHFVNECRSELKKMDKLVVGYGQTMRQFIDRRGVTNCIPGTTYELKQLLKVLNNNTFPVYLDVIASATGRLQLETQLEEVPMYVVKTSPESPCGERKVILDYDSACEVAKFLPDKDLLRVMVAVFDTSCIKKRKLEEETSLEDPAKRLRRHL